MGVILLKSKNGSLMKAAKSYLSIDSIMEDTTDTINGRNVIIDQNKLDQGTVQAYISPRGGLRVTDVDHYVFWISTKNSTDIDDDTILIGAIDDDGTAHSVTFSTQYLIENYNLTAPDNSYSTYYILCYAVSKHGYETPVTIAALNVMGQYVNTIIDGTVTLTRNGDSLNAQLTPADGVTLLTSQVDHWDITIMNQYEEAENLTMAIYEKTDHIDIDSIQDKFGIILNKDEYEQKNYTIMAQVYTVTNETSYQYVRSNYITYTLEPYGDTIDGINISLSETKTGEFTAVLSESVRTQQIDSWEYTIVDQETTTKNTTDKSREHTFKLSDLSNDFDVSAPINSSSDYTLKVRVKSTNNTYSNWATYNFTVQGETVSIFNDCEIKVWDISDNHQGDDYYVTSLTLIENNIDSINGHLSRTTNSIITKDDLDYWEYYVDDQYSKRIRRNTSTIPFTSVVVYGETLEATFTLPEQHGVTNNIILNIVCHATNGETLTGPISIAYKGALYDTVASSNRLHKEGRTPILTTINSATVKASLDADEWSDVPLLTKHIYAWNVWFDSTERPENYIQITQKNSTPDITLDLTNLQAQLLNIDPNTTETHTLYVEAVSIDDATTKISNIDVELSGDVQDTVVGKDLRFHMGDADNGDWFVAVFQDSSSVLESQISKWECYIVGQESNVYTFANSSNTVSITPYWKTLAESTLNFDVPHNTLKEFQLAFRVKSTLDTYSNVGTVTMYVDNRDTVANANITLTNTDNNIKVTNTTTVEYQIDHIEYYIVGQESSKVSIPVTQSYVLGKCVNSTWLNKSTNDNYYHWPYYQYTTITPNTNYWNPYIIFSSNISMSDIESNFDLSVADNSTKTFELKVKVVSIYDTESAEATYEFTKSGTVVDTIVNKTVTVTKSGNNYVATLASGALASQVSSWKYWVQDNGSSKSITGASTTASVSLASLNLTAPDNETVNYVLKFQAQSTFGTTSKTGQITIPVTGNTVDTIDGATVTVTKVSDNINAFIDKDGVLASQVDHWEYWIQGDTNTKKTVNSSTTSITTAISDLNLTAPDNSSKTYTIIYQAVSTLGGTTATGTVNITVTGAVVDTINGKTLTVTRSGDTLTFALPSSSLASQVDHWYYYVDEVLNKSTTPTTKATSLALSVEDIISEYGLTAPDNGSADYNIFCRVESTLGGASNYAVYTLTVAGADVELDDETTYSSYTGGSGNYVRVRFSDASIDPTTLNVDPYAEEEYSVGTWTKCTDTTLNDWIYKKSGEWVNVFRDFFNATTNPSLANCTVKIMKGSHTGFYYKYAFYGCDRLTEVHNYFMAAKDAEYVFAESGVTKVKNCTFRGEAAAADYMTTIGYFYNCRELVSITDCTFYNLYYIRTFFWNCRKLENLPNICAKFSGCNSNRSESAVSEHGYYSNCFYNCNNVKTGMLENYNSIKSWPERKIFDGCGTNTEEGMEARAQIPKAWGGDLTEEHDTVTYVPTITTEYKSNSSGEMSLAATLDVKFTGQAAEETQTVYVKYPGESNFTRIGATTAHSSATFNLTGSKFSAGSNEVVVRVTCEHDITTDKTLTVEVESFNTDSHNEFTIDSVTFSSGSKRLYWHLSNDDYVTPEGITFQISLNNGANIFDAGSALSYDFSILDPGSYTFTVIATCKHNETVRKTITGIVPHEHVEFALVGIGYDGSTQQLMWDIAYADDPIETMTYTISTPFNKYTVVDETTLDLTGEGRGNGYQLTLTANCEHGNKITKQFSVGSGGDFIYVSFGSSEGGAVLDPDTHTDFNIDASYDAENKTINWTIT